MVLSRVVHMGLAFGEFVSSCVVLGLVAHFLYEYDHGGSGGPLAREIYTIVVAALSVIFSALFFIPRTANMMHYPLDLFMSAAWFAAFGILVDFIKDQNCGGIWYWGGIARGGYCSQWKATEAFSFIAAVLWFTSMLLGIYVTHVVGRRTKRNVTAV